MNFDRICGLFFYAWWKMDRLTGHRPNVLFSMHKSFNFYIALAISELDQRGENSQLDIANGWMRMLLHPNPCGSQTNPTLHHCRNSLTTSCIAEFAVHGVWGTTFKINIMNMNVQPIVEARGKKRCNEYFLHRRIQRRSEWHIRARVSNVGVYYEFPVWKFFVHRKPEV